MNECASEHPIVRFVQYHRLVFRQIQWHTTSQSPSLKFAPQCYKFCGRCTVLVPCCAAPWQQWPTCSGCGNYHVTWQTGGATVRKWEGLAADTPRGHVWNARVSVRHDPHWL